MRDLFGAKGASENTNVEIGAQMNHLKDENDRLYFELRQEYDMRENNLKSQKE